MIKRIISILLIALILLTTMTGCKLLEEVGVATIGNKSHLIERNYKYEEYIEYHPESKFWIDRQDWKSMKEKEPQKLKLMGISEYPFRLKDFANNIKEVNTLFTKDENGKMMQTITNVNDLYTKKYIAEAGFNASDVALGIYLKPENEGDTKNDPYFAICCTDAEEKTILTKDALESKSYIFWSDYRNPHTLLNIDMSGATHYLPYNNTYQDKTTDITELLDEIIKIYGKPDRIDPLIWDDYEIESRSLAYDMIYEYEDYVIMVCVTEGNVRNKEQVESAISIAVFTDVSWQQYNEYKENFNFGR